MKKSAKDLIWCLYSFTNNWLKLHGYTMVRNGGVFGYKVKITKKRKLNKYNLPFI